MKTIKNSLIYFGVCLIIFTSFKVPEILFEMENKKMETAIYPKENLENTMDVEAEKIYLVKAIHDIENEYNTVAISNNSLAELPQISKVDIMKELLKLKEYNIIQNLDFEEDKILTKIIERYYEKEMNFYIFNNIYLLIKGVEYHLEMEDKTGKIVSITLKTENVPENREEVMRKYIEYLDLYIIDDWKLEDYVLKSEKAQLVVNLTDYEDYCVLSIHSMNAILNNVEYVDFVK